MTDAGGPQRHTLCFLSTLLSQKVPEKSDTVLHCEIAGQPKPEVTWYKNGQTIEDCDIVSSYESFENQYTHMLHLYCCSQNDAAVYQISAKNGFGMICCSASVEVECSSENPQLSPNLTDDRDTGWQHGTETSKQNSTDQIDEKEPPYKEEERPSLGTPSSADSPSSEFNHLCSLQLLVSNDVSTPSSENPLDDTGTRQTEEACDLSDTEAIADGLLFPNISGKQDVCCPRTMQPEGATLTNGALHNDSPDDEDLNSSYQNSNVQKHISISLPLLEAATSIYPGDWATVNKQDSSQASSRDSDSDYELCPEITLTCTEEFSDDDLEYLECSDVMTDYSNAVWQWNLQGPEHVFLLESDDEVMEFSECCLGECEPFLSEMGSGPQVSDNSGPMEVIPGFCGYHSQPQEVWVRRHQDSTHSSSSPQTGMTLTLGPDQDATSTVTDQGKYKLPIASAENDYPGIQGETRDTYQAGEEFVSDNLLDMNKAVTGREGKRMSGELEKPGMSQCLETTAEKRVEEKDFRSRRGSEKSARARRPGLKGKPKKPNPNLKDRTTEGTLHLLYPKEAVKHPLLAQSETTESSHAKSEATDLNCHFHAGEGAISTQAEQGAKTLPTSPGILPKEGDLNLEGEGVQVDNLLETSWVPGQNDHPQVQIQETVSGRTSLSQMPAFSKPAEEEPAFTGTTTNSCPNSGAIEEKDASVAQYLEIGCCSQGPQCEEIQDREDSAPGHSWEEVGHELRPPEADHANMSACELPLHLPQEGSTDSREPKAPSAASPGPANIVPIQETVRDGPRGRDEASEMEHLEADDQGTCDTMASPVGAPVDKYLPQDIRSMASELAESQSKVSDVCAPDEKTLDVPFQTQASEPPQSTCRSSNNSNSVVSPPSISTSPWNMSQKASEGAAGEEPAKVENSTSALASTGQVNQETLDPGISGGLEERQPLSFENSFVQFEKGGDESPSTSALDTTDRPVSQETGKCPQEMSTTLTENLEVTRESGDTPTVTMATEVHPAIHLPVSDVGNSHADGPEQNSPQVPDESSCQLLASGPLGHILNGSTIEAPGELLCVGPSGSGVPVCVVPPPGEGFCSNSALHIDEQPGDKSPTMYREDSRNLEESFPGQGSETTQKVQQDSLPPQGSLSQDNFQDSWPTTSAAQRDIHPVPLDHSSANSEEERGQRSNSETSMSVVTKATVENDSQVVSNDPPLSNSLLEQCKQCGPGLWEAGNKVKIITLEASVAEAWPSQPPTDAECKESEAGAMIPDGVWALSDVLKAGAAGLELGLSEIAASARSPQAGPGSALANSREIHRTHWSCLSSQYLNQPRFLESSVDPIDEKGLRVVDLPSGAPETGGQENVNNVSQKQEENHLGVDRPAFFKQLLTSPKILESSVDPIDETSVEEWKAETQELSESTPGVITEDSTLNDGNLDQRVDVQAAILPVPCLQQSGETVSPATSITSNQGASDGGEADQSQHDKVKADVQPAILPVPGPDKGGETTPSGDSRSQVQEGHERSSGKAEQTKNHQADLVFPTLPLSSCLAMTQAPVDVAAHNATGAVQDVPENNLVEPRSLQCAFSDSGEKGAIMSECGDHLCLPSGLTQLPFASPPEGNITDFSIIRKIEEPETEEPPNVDTKPTSATCSPAGTLALISGERVSETALKTPQDPCLPSFIPGPGRKPGEQSFTHRAAPADRPPVTATEEVKKKLETTGSGYLAEGVKKKILSRVAALRLRLEEKEKARKNSSFLKKIPKLETSVSHTDEKKDPQKPPCKREGKAPVLLKKIQAEMFPDHSGNVKLSCQFAEIHEDSTVWWTKDSESIAQVQRSAGDNSTVSLVIVQAGQKDQGLYYCSIKNSYGTVTAEFNLTTEVLEQLTSHQDTKGCEEIEFSQLIFKEDFLHDSYFGGRLRGQIATEELHFGEGVHRKAFRSKVMQGLMPVFQPGHACVLKVHNAVAYGTRNNDELVQRNYKLAAQECYVQNTARYYAKIYAAEAQPLEGFGEVPEIIPIFLIHRPENNIPYATVEEELIGEFVKYSIRDGKEINFLRRESEAGQKCCTFQHWVYEKTGGCLLVTDMQGVGMKLTDVGIATLAKGYKGFKGNCSMTFIDQFKALHQCNKYCKMLGLKSLQNNNNQKSKKPSVGKTKIQPNSTMGKKTASAGPAEKKT